jgi:hypothetical protein
MSIQLGKYAVVLALGIAIGGMTTFTLGSHNARAFYAEAQHRVPRGYLVAESKLASGSTVTIDLAGSYGTNSGDTLHHYFGGTSAAFCGSIFFSYPSSNMPGVGDVFLLKVETPNGKIQSFVVVNGGYGTIFESNEMVLSYFQGKNERRVRT